MNNKIRFTLYAFSVILTIFTGIKVYGEEKVVTYLCDKYPRLYKGDTPYRNNSFYDPKARIENFCVNGPIMRLKRENNTGDSITGIMSGIVKDANGNLLSNTVVKISVDESVRTDAMGNFRNKLKTTNGEIVTIEGVLKDTQGNLKPYGQFYFTKPNRDGSADTITTIDYGEFSAELIPYYEMSRVYVPGDRGFGSLSGTVIDNYGNPIERVKVYTVPKPTGWEQKYYPVVYTDSNGHFTMSVPAASSRWIVSAEKEGYISNKMGNFQIWPGEDTAVTLTLLPKDVPDANIYSDELIVRALMVDEVNQEAIDADKIIPLDSTAVLNISLYPDNVRPYLEDDIYNSFNNPVVQAAIEEIRQSIPIQDKTKELAVAKAAFDWISQNVHRETAPYSEDPTAAAKLGFWAKNLEDWYFTAEEGIQRKRAICLDHERILAALLRGLNIPARVTPVQAHPTTQFWLQLPDGSGYWGNMEASRGGGWYTTDHNNLSSGSPMGFPSRFETEIKLIPIDGGTTPAHHHVDLNNETYFQETMQYAYYSLDEEGRNAIKDAVLQFKERGSANGMGDFDVMNPGTVTCTEPYYKAYIFGSTIQLTNLGTQRIINVKWPLSNYSPWHRLCNINIDSNEFMKSNLVEYASGRLAEYYTNHPEWTENAEITTEYNGRTGLTMKFLNVRFNLDRR